MISPRALRYAAFASLLATACSLNLDHGGEATVARNECSQNSDCGPGECWQGACVAGEGELSSVLLEVATPKGEVGASVGGLRFLKHQTNLSRSSSDNPITLEPATEVVGSLLANGCGEEQGRRSFRAEVTFTPREDSYGLPVVTYTARTERIPVEPRTACARELTGLSEVDQFSVWVPSGSYDVYVKPLEEPPGCVVSPQLIRRKPFSSLGETCLLIPRTEPRKLTVVVPWPVLARGADSLDGWKIDVVHPITGHVLSEQTYLSEDDRTETAVGHGYRHEVHYTPLPVEEVVKEIVRLSPPAGVVAPVIQADRTGLQVASEEATFPNIGPFPPPVKLGGRVQFGGTEDHDAEAGIPGRAILTATSLKDIKAGVFASYSTSAVVGRDGEVIAEVLPGVYRLRFVPDLGTGFASTESEVTAKCQPNLAGTGCATRTEGLTQQVQYGPPFKVKDAAVITGHVVDSGSGEQVGQVSVDAVAAFVSTRTCASDPSNVACAVVGVLDIALGDEAFMPRSVSGIVQSGFFKLKGLDCGKCEAGSGALFDVLVKPPEESRRAWGLMPDVPVISGNNDVGIVELPLPVIHRGTIEISPRVTVNRALLRAYILRDETGARIADPTGMPSCSMVASSGAALSSTHCIRSVLQVAETTSDDEGRFELVLPSRIKEIE